MTAHRLLKWLLVVALSVLVVLMPACGLLSAKTKSQVVATLDQELASGDITKAQHDAAVEAINRDGSVDWAGLGFAAVNVALALVGGPAVVRVMRGPPTQSVGLSADKVQGLEDAVAAAVPAPAAASPGVPKVA